MDDISQKLSELLNSPDGMEKIRAAAAGLLGNEQEVKKPDPDQKQNDNDLNGFSIPEGLLGGLGNIQGIMRIANLLSAHKEDSRVELLLALKPHLSNERAHKVDRAVAMLKVASLLPILKEEGLLDAFGLN